MKYETWTTLVQEGIKQIIKSTDPLEISGFAKRIQSADRIFLMGSGRTGLVVEMFAMRLTQLGLPVFVVSQPTTPALEKTDLLILVSGSGETGEILNAAKKAIEIGADTYGVTQNKDSSLGNLIKEKLIIPSPPEEVKALNGTLFEMSLLITCDAVVAEVLEITDQSFEEMTKRHANL